MVIYIAKLYSILLYCLGSSEPSRIMTGPPFNTAVQTNGSATLQCVVSEDSSSQITWLAGSPLTASALFVTPDPVDTTSSHYTVVGNSLLVTEFNNMHEGEYTCKAESDSPSKTLLSCPGTLSHASKFLYYNN